MPRKADVSYDHEIASLYRQEVSAKDVATKLKIPLHRVYDALVRRKIPRKSPEEQHRIRFAKIPLSFNFRQKFTRKQRDLLVAGSMLYYGEGAKTGHGVDFTNSDTTALQVFLKFLRDICGVDIRRLRFYLYCFSNQNPKQLITF